MELVINASLRCAEAEICGKLMAASYSVQLCYQKDMVRMTPLLLPCHRHQGTAPHALELSNWGADTHALEKRTDYATKMRELVLVTYIVSNGQELYGYKPACHYIVLNNVPWLHHPKFACSVLIILSHYDNGPTQEFLFLEGWQPDAYSARRLLAKTVVVSSPLPFWSSTVSTSFW